MSTSATVCRLRRGAGAVGAGVLALLGPCTPAHAQTSPRCADPAYRQMDFWIGSWEVRDADGVPVGRSTIEPILGRCALREIWDAGDMHGTSLNTYDAPAGTWRQMWVDDFGAVLRLDGVWNGEAMVLRGSRLGSDGKTRRLRVTLMPEDDGLRQVQERSEDDGRTWVVIFDGRYRRTGGGPPPRSGGSPRSAPSGSG